jgi:hypothetical protein
MHEELSGVRIMAYTTIDDPSAYFQTKIYTGNGGALAVTNDGNSDLQPDWAWFKKRGGSEGHALFDTNRGIARFLASNSTAVEQHQPTTGNTDADDIASFDSDGFTFQGGGGAINQSSNTYVAWQWKANGGTVANDTNGDITTSVQASQTAGFSIATYTGNGGSGQTLGHGLGANADLIIFKDRESASAWRTYVRLLGASKSLDLNTTNAANTSTNIFPSHSTTTIGVEQNDVMNKNNSDFVMYSFRSIQGYSKIGTYTGNGNADGPFVYTGFKPAWVMVKEYGANTNDWNIYDSKRSAFNSMDDILEANLSDAEGTGRADIDFLSNGFKQRNTHADSNRSSGEFIYMAFAESPFVSSKGVPTTAR